MFDIFCDKESIIVMALLSKRLYIRQDESHTQIEKCCQDGKKCDSLILIISAHTQPRALSANKSLYGLS